MLLILLMVMIFWRSSSIFLTQRHFLKLQNQHVSSLSLFALSSFELTSFWWFSIRLSSWQTALRIGPSSITTCTAPDLGSVATLSPSNRGLFVFWIYVIHITQRIFLCYSSFLWITSILKNSHLLVTILFFVNYIIDFI